VLRFAVAAFLAAVAPATAQGQEAGAPAAAPDSLAQQVGQAYSDIKAGRNNEALAKIGPLAAAVTARLHEVPGPVYCARSAGEADIYKTQAMPNSSAVKFVKSQLCDVLFLHAYVLVNLHRTPEAIAQLRSLIALEPAFPHYQVEYGSALREVGDLDGALAAYRRAVELAAPVKDYALDQAGGLRGIGFVLTERGDLDGAEKAYRQSLELAPGHPVAVNELGYIARLRSGGARTQAQTVESNSDPAKAALPKVVQGQ